MARDSAIPAKSFDEILAWLNPDREVAGVMYVQLRHDLSKLFTWSKCSDPEELTDEVFDRVARKVHNIRQTYQGDPRLYFRAVANNLIKESRKKIKTQIPLEDVDLSQSELDESEEESHRILTEKLLKECIDELPHAERQLILNYYLREKRDARKLAAALSISQGTLRVRIHRIRQSLLRKIERKLETT
jgi:RNA polymerase sigma factor (sigma-70 family)